MSKVYIIDAKRSAIGSFLGTLSPLSPSELAGQVMKNMMETNNIDGTKVDEVILGNVLSAGQGQNVARQASIKAGLPETVPAYTMNMVCGSGMKSLMTAYSTIKAGMANVMFVGGVEVMSQAPFVTSPQVRTGKKMGQLQLEDSIIQDGLTDAFHQYHMGITAENIAEKHQITREEQDRFAMKSQERAIKANDSGRFADEIVPVEIKDRKKNVRIFDKDEYPNYSTSIEKLGSLRTAFKKDGTVTAGNASGINDGTAILLVASEEAVKQYDLQPLAEIVAVGQGGVDPSVMGLGPVKAIADLFKTTHIQPEQIELMELNEAFASQSIGVIKELQENHGWTEEWMDANVNVNGGAIALGHPLGASGARIITTLIHEMKKQSLQYGLASLCIGGGMGTAVVVKMV
ncbi:acetyl-CoA C-acetyltransferase [Pontibacillus litoralis]|uniref:acetyl-CoA C-acetyltransferase n=1 Tax=Pontibacillus litoralis JSM 072002 TaxID=1385512 RepID=A0A0A5G3L4_9BACI|nr:acetyl-CoA C-acetyltransferase [Pontibacillus litoralis]KGX86624.1 3-ketoacyl-CoA thiolase [Pontibacillus litoralis JSM 072002]